MYIYLGVPAVSIPVAGLDGPSPDMGVVDICTHMHQNNMTVYRSEVSTYIILVVTLFVALG